MGTPEARVVVDGYLEAIAACDYGAARGWLADSGFSYVSPLRSFSDADALIADVSRIETIMKDVVRRHTFVDGDDVCVIMDFRTTIAELAENRVALWATVADRRIRRMELFFDTHAYARMFGD